MARLVLTRKFSIELSERIEFIALKDAAAAERASNTILSALEKLSELPQIGRPANDDSPRRMLMVRFGSKGYVVPYIYANDEVILLGIRNFREDWMK